MADSPSQPTWPEGAATTANRTPAYTNTPRNNPLPPLQSRRQKYARPEDLPSYPSSGLKENSAAASAAASLGWANRKLVEPWKPTSSASSSAAAVLARDYKMAQAWEPEKSSAGHLAARMAAGSAQKQVQSPKSPPSTWGNSAASIAFEAARANSPKVVQEDTKKITRHGSLHAARASVSRTRTRSKSTPQPVQHTYPDQANAAANALSAATIAHRPSLRVAVLEGGSVPYTTMNRQMYTSHPPVKPEVDEQRHADVLHASAIAMAKRMYVQQQRMIDTTKRAEMQRKSSFSRHGAESPESSDGNLPPAGFPNLQEAAYRLAQERLSKLHEEHQKQREFQEYYGPPGVTTAQQRSKFGTIRGKLTRKRSSSDGDVVDDRRRSQQIRRQMSMLNTNISKVDEQQRARDREAVLAAAQRNVRAQLEGMDQKLYSETGRITPRMLTEWELKAHTAAQERADARKSDNFGKVDLGAGKFMDRNEVDNIAARKVQPLIDDINQRAEEERERLAAEKLEEERKRLEAEKEKARERELKEIQKKLKEQEKEEERERKAEIKQEAKAKKEEERAAKAERKRQAKEEKITLRDAPKSAVAPGLPRRVSEGDRLPTLKRNAAATPERVRSPLSRQGAESPLLDDEESPPPAAKMRNWLRSRFSRPRARSSGSAAIGDETGRGAATKKASGGFIGGARLHRKDDPGNLSVDRREDSMREVALATAAPEPTPGVVGAGGGVGSGAAATAGRERRDSVSTVSSGDEFVEARDHVSSPQLVRPPALQDSPGAKSTGSPRESRFSEIID